jgi:hypothetical protein
MTDLVLKRLPDYLKYKLGCSWWATFYALPQITRQPRVCSYPCVARGFYVVKENELEGGAESNVA